MPLSTFVKTSADKRAVLFFVTPAGELIPRSRGTRDIKFCILYSVCAIYFLIFAV